MIEVNNKRDCCGCTACMNICPKKAIQMVEDEEGFLYPKVDKSLCINCGLCEKVCPIKNQLENRSEISKAYVVRSKDLNILMSSTSGGFFSPLAQYYINKSGVVYGVGFGANFRIEHKRASNMAEIEEFKGSKYCQSYLGNIFNEVKKDLQSNKPVVFSGTPCQVEGLLKFLVKKYDNLLTVDIICHGTPSPKLWDLYVEEQEKKYKSKIKNVAFRNKTYGYHSGTMKLEFENGKKYYGSARVDEYLKSFFTEISSRPSCYDCKFKKRNHNSDITIYDCWSFSKLVKNIKDDDKGYTNIIVNTMKGDNILNELNDMYSIYQVDLDSQIECDGIMVENSVIPHKNRENYYKELYKIGLKDNCNKYIKISTKDRIIEKSKLFLYRIGLLKFIKKMKGK